MEATPRDSRVSRGDFSYTYTNDGPEVRIPSSDGQLALGDAPVAEDLSYAVQNLSVHESRKQKAGHRRTCFWQHPLMQANGPVYPAGSYQGQYTMDALLPCPQH